MTKLLQDAIQRVATLSPEEQDAIASQILETLDDETAWKLAFEQKGEKLGKLAADAIREHQKGDTRPIDEIL